MYDLKFVDRTGNVPHRSFRVQCSAFHIEQVKVRKGQTAERYAPSIAQTSFPFEDDSRWEAVEDDTLVLFVNVIGAPGYKYIAGRHMLLFIMNNEGKTIDRMSV